MGTVGVDLEKGVVARRRMARASLACEGIVLLPEEEAMFDQFDAEGVEPEVQRIRLIEYSRAKRREKALHKA